MGGIHCSITIPSSGKMGAWRLLWASVRTYSYLPIHQRSSIAPPPAFPRFCYTNRYSRQLLSPGSLFNHSSAPNVSYTLDPTTESIRYTTTRRILTGEELCIFYGHKLWFDAVDTVHEPSNTADADVPVEDGFGGLAGLEMDEDGDENALAGPSSDPTAGAILGPCPYGDGQDDDILQDENLPFTWLKPPPEEEEPGSVRTS